MDFIICGSAEERGRRVPSILPRPTRSQRVFGRQTKPRWATVPWPNYTLWLQSYGEERERCGELCGPARRFNKVYKRYEPVPTCRARGFQRMFLSSAGAELSVLCGRFFRVRDTTPLSALSEPTRLRNCQPTCGWKRTGALKPAAHWRKLKKEKQTIRPDL